MRILVTGGAGFIGSAFVELLLRERPQVEVTVLDRLTYAGNPANLEPFQSHPGFRFVHGDIADPDAVRDAMTGCDTVVNFAAESHVDRSLEDPNRFLRTNLLGVSTLLNAARDLGVRRFLHVSTDEVYGPLLTGSATEDAPLWPANPYSASKAGADLLALSYVKSFGMDVVITRGANTIGPRQYPEKATPLFITHAMDNLPLPIYGTGEAVREYQYVEDHCRGVLTALEQADSGAIVHVGGGPATERNTIQLAEAILERVGRPKSLIRFVPDRPGHDMRYSLNTDRLKGLGWAPHYDFDATLDATVNWYLANEAWWRPLKNGDYQDYYRRQYGSLGA